MSQQLEFPHTNAQDIEKPRMTATQRNFNKVDQDILGEWAVEVNLQIN